MLLECVHSYMALIASCVFLTCIVVQQCVLFLPTHMPLCAVYHRAGRVATLLVQPHERDGVKDLQAEEEAFSGP